MTARPHDEDLIAPDAELSMGDALGKSAEVFRECITQSIEDDKVVARAMHFREGQVRAIGGAGLKAVIGFGGHELGSNVGGGVGEGAVCSSAEGAGFFSRMGGP
ncbi:hypothetical protein MK280_11775 [Myxococcota bacterium]|nr:hypothetical protein [Myxococcota bacterium]